MWTREDYPKGNILDINSGQWGEEVQCKGVDLLCSSLQG